jgi:hypothetical protein
MRIPWKRNPDSQDFDAWVRARRPEASSDFLEPLIAHARDERLARDERRSRPRSLRVAFAAVLSGLILVALASTGGLGYAAAGAEEAYEAVEAVVDSSEPSFASDGPSDTQYGKRCGNPHEDKERKIKPPPCPIQAGNVKVTEGQSGTTSMTFPITIADDYEPEATVTVEYVTADGTALAVLDYIPTSGTVTFLAGETATSATVQVVGDTVSEPDETVFLILSNPSANAVIVDDQGEGTIENDDN